MRWNFITFSLFVFFAMSAVPAFAVDFPTAVSFPGGAGTAADDSKLSAAEFPKTEISFADRVALMKSGFEPFETQYDAAGRCISGCAYAGMNMEDESRFYQRRTEIAVARAKMMEAMNPSKPKTLPLLTQIEQDELDDSDEWDDSGFDDNLTDEKYSAAGGQCMYETKPGIANSEIPNGYPITGGKITSHYGRRTPPATGNGRVGSAYHYGLDIGVPVGTGVFSTIDGRVAVAGRSGDCGNYVKITARSGFSVGYCHLSDILVRVGDTVSAGCMVAKSGNTGNSSGPHLHYMVFDKSGFRVNPMPFMNNG